MRAELSGTLDKQESDFRFLMSAYSSKSDELTWTTIELGRTYDKIDKLQELVQDMWFWRYEGHMDSESQEWQMRHIDGVLDRMLKLGVKD